MKIFFVKTIIVAITFYFVFELTIGSKIRLVQDSILKYKNKTERVKIKEKWLVIPDAMGMALFAITTAQMAVKMNLPLIIEFYN